MVSIDQSLFIQIANFLILIWILNAILYKPVRNVLLQRKEKVTGLERDIELSQKEAKEKEDAFSSGIREARTIGLKKKELLVQAAADEEKEIVRKINEKAAEDLARVREKIAQDADAVRASLLGEVDIYASEIGKKILGRAV